MTLLLETLQIGDRVSATFSRRNYATFTVQGTAVQSASATNFMVGSLVIESNRKPDKSVLSLVVESQVPAPEAAAHAPPGKAEDRAAVAAVLSELAHGDMVHATFEQHPHGRFTVTGPAVQALDGRILAVGTWFLAVNGNATARLKDLTVVAQAGTHGLPVPNPITSWEYDEVSE